MITEALVRIRLDPGNTEQASNRVAGSLERVGRSGELSARRTANAMRQLPAQLSDVASQLAGGQNPLLVLVQQGPQVAYSFGGVRAAAAALLGGITPLTVGFGALGVAAIGAGVAFTQGALQSIKLRDTLALTGNAAGLTEDRISGLAERVSAASGQTVGAAREIALALAATGRTTSTLIESQATAIARIADLSGQSAEQLTQRFASQLEGPARFAAELNRTYNFLTVEQFKRIQQLEAEGKKAQAAAETNQILTDRLRGQRTQLSYLERALETASEKWSKFWLAAQGLGRDMGAEQRLKQIQGEIQTILRASGGKEPAQGTASAMQIETLRFKAAGLAEQIRQQRQEADDESARAQRVQAGIDKAIEEEERRKRDRERAANENERLRLERSAIRDPQGQMRQDFLRSEKGVYEALIEDERKAREEQAKTREQQRKDLAERVEDQKKFFVDLSDQNARAAAELIADERARADALVRLDRETAERRLAAMGFNEDQMREARKLLDEQAAMRYEQNARDAKRVGQVAGDSTYDDVRNALAAAFRDTRDPVQAFADALGNAVFTRVSARLADAMATNLVGKDGQGGLFGDILKFAVSLGSGTPVEAGAAATYGMPSSGTPFPLATGTNYVPSDNFPALLHKGEAVVPAKFNPAAGGIGTQVQYAPTSVFNIDARADRADILALMQAQTYEQQRAVEQFLRERGLV